MLATSKIYIAGHNGLVGSALTRTLKSRGYNNLILRSLGELDLIDQHQVEEFFASEKPEYVIVAAAMVGGIVANNTYRADFIYKNIMIQSNVINCAWRHNVKKLLFLGSTCIYPKEAPQPLKEDYLLSSGLEYTNEPYAIAKIAGLKMCESYNIQYKTNFISVMPTNLYGAGDNFDLEKSHVLPALLRRFHLGKCLGEGNWVALRDDLTRNPIDTVSGSAGEKEIIATLEKYGISLQGNSSAKNSVIIKVWGSGKPLREFMNSQDMAEACIFLMENVDIQDIINIHTGADKGKDYHPPHFLNIGTGEELSIRELANKVKSVTGFAGEIDFDHTKPDGTMRKVTDITALRNLGYKHRIDLESGLKKMYEDYLTR